MVVEKTRSVRKLTGGRYKPYRKSRQFAVVHKPILTTLGEHKTICTRSAGGHTKYKIVETKKISVADPKKKKVVLATIQDVTANDANRNYIVRDIVNKGAIVQTNIGKVRVTSRPGQTGCLSGVLIE